MIDIDRAGEVPLHHMDGIGDAYVYEAIESGPTHFRLHDMEHIWEFITGDLGSGEVLADGTYNVVDGFRQSRRLFDMKRRVRHAS